MKRIESQNIDLELSQNYISGVANRYQVYYFDIYLHDTYTRIGYIDLRVGKSTYLYYLGNIGYRIDEPYRGNHYALEAVKAILPFAKEKGMNKLIITCDPNNTASRKTLDHLNATCYGDKKVPITCALYYEGDRIKRIYELNLED